MRHKIVLYNPDTVFWTMPLALVNIGSYLDKEKFDVIIIDGRLDSRSDLFHHLKDAICLGITVLTGAPLGDALSVSKEGKRLHPDLPIVWGGWHPSIFPEMCVSAESVTAVVIAQGEETFAEIVDRFIQKRTLDGIKGCFYKDSSGKIIDNGHRELCDINEFPYLDYSLINVEKYFVQKGSRQFDYISSQGCPFRCNFCVEPTVYKRKWFAYSPERFINEVDILHKQYHFTELALQDETYFAKQGRVVEIAEGFIKKGFDFTWTATVRANQVARYDDETFAVCKRSGLRRVMIGIEAGSKATSDFIQKDITTEDIWITADKLLKYKIGAIFSFIVGFPNESAESVTETLSVASKLRTMSANFDVVVFYFKPYPGNRIGEYLKEQNYHFPETLEQWVNFDEYSSETDWLSESQIGSIEQFKFYLKNAYSINNNPLLKPIKSLSKWRLANQAFKFPIDYIAANWIRDKYRKLKQAPKDELS
jgi:radical SAM superfamily enzyme YgiQ (UPF0313 family)